MKKIALGISTLLAFAVLPLMASAADAPKTVTGEPIDIKCYMGGKSGEAHASCAETCAGKGSPVGLLTEEGGKKVVYLVMGGGGKDAKDLVKGHMGKKVTATGTVADKDGIKVITVTEIKDAK